MPLGGVETRWKVPLAGLTLAVAIFAVYLGSVSGPFVFDDIPSIPQNPTIRQLWPLSGPLAPPGAGETVTGRPLLNLSFALNHAWGGDTPAGYRATNIAIHVAAAWLLFGLVRRTLQRPILRERFGDTALPLAGVIAALWALHPLQTESVTYIVQRAESLMGLLFLLTLYGFVRAVETKEKKTSWLTVAWSACLLGMATKEVMVSAPVLVACYDRVFVAGTWREAWRQRGRFHVALASTWLLLAWLVLGASDRGGTLGFGIGVSWAGYWATQFRAIVDYVALAFWPHPLVLDYGVVWTRGAADVAPYAAGVLALVAGTIVAFVRGWPVAWLAVAFLAWLAPTSVIPGGRQTMAEHRMYLPLAAVLAIAVPWAYAQLGRRALLAGTAVALAFGAATWQRNTDYRSVLGIWGDTVAKRPDNRWARDNFANALAEAGRPEEALRHYAVALQLDPSDATPHYNAGSALLQLGRVPEAVAQLREAVRLKPAYAAARNNLADALYRLGRFDEAIAEYAILERDGSDGAELHYNLGNAFAHAGRHEEAITELTKALQRRSDYPEAAYNLGCVYVEVGRVPEAAAQFERALRLHRDDADAHNAFANVLVQLDRIDEAAAQAREAVRLNPAIAQSHFILGMIALYRGAREAGLAELTEAARLAPDNPEVRQNLERARRASAQP